MLMSPFLVVENWNEIMRDRKKVKGEKARLRARIRERQRQCSSMLQTFNRDIRSYDLECS